MTDDAPTLRELNQDEYHDGELFEVACENCGELGLNRLVEVEDDGTPVVECWACGAVFALIGLPEAERRAS